ncbi:hypothetical protein V8C42DRAFT_325225 [Trichoderma barbatum]
MTTEDDLSPRGDFGAGATRIADSVQTARLEEDIRELRLNVRTLNAHIAALRNDHSALQQRVNQLGGGLVPPILPESQLPLLPVVPSGDTSLYARRIGFANYSQVDAAYQRDTVQFIGRLKAILYDSLVPHRWEDDESVGRMRQFFVTYGISVDLLEDGEHQDANFSSVAQSDLVVRSDLITRHLRSHFWVNGTFVLYWTLLEICRQYGVYW